jgi:hypothetical protein
MRQRFPFSCAVLLGVLIGFPTLHAQEVPFLLTRVVSFFPFFVAGLTVKRNKYLMETLQQLIVDRVIKGWACFMLIPIIGFPVYLAQMISPASLVSCEDKIRYLDADFEEPNYPDNWPVMHALSRVFNYPVALIVTFALCALMPARESVLRRAGSRTLGPYVMQRWVWFVVEHAFPRWNHDYDARHVIPQLLVYWGLMFLMYLPVAHEILRHVIIVPLDSMGLLRGTTCTLLVAVDHTAHCANKVAPAPTGTLRATRTAPGYCTMYGTLPVRVSR